MSMGETNLAWADAFVAGLVAAGLRHVAFGPGARSAPLAFACLRRPELECHVINDERAAAWFALGIAKASGPKKEAAAVLCTSGTAAANLLPAVMEANLAAVPLLVLTADRPAEAHGWGANQTADQAKLYGSQVRAFHDIPELTPGISAAYLPMLAMRLLAECRAPLPGPVHANLPFREPLLPGSAAEVPAPPALPASPARHAGKPAVIENIAALAAALSGKPGIIVCGEGNYAPAFAAALCALADKLDAPILAEPLSNLRFGNHDRSRILAHQARFLKHAGLPAPDWVLRFGAFPVSRSVERYLAGLAAAHHALVAPPGRWPDPLWRSDRVVHADPLAVADALLPLCRPAGADFCNAWRAAEEEAARRAASLCATDTLCEGSVARLLLDALPAGTQCFVGNSLAIRAVDAFSGTGEKPLALHGNRGASGIDGNLATAAGIAVATGAPLAVLVGDQTALHDCSSLALLAQGDKLVVVMDNGGGGIFDHLPFAAALPAATLRRGWTAPSAVDFGALAAAFGLRHVAAANAAELHAALQTALAEGGPWLVRAVIDRTASRAQFF